MRLAVALGGNALMRRGEGFEPGLQKNHLQDAVAALARLAESHELVITHGNGPQVGLLALQAEAYRGGPAVTLDVLGAESEGWIGYLLAQELDNALPGREVATLLTQVEVSAQDQAFDHPTKPIGPMYTEDEALRLARERGWSVARDGSGYRRVVASPLPRRILELRTIRRLLDAGVMVVCGGGGGIPVVVGEDGRVRGVEAVIDKDRSAALLAEGVGAEGLLLLTDTPGVYASYGTPEQRLLVSASPEELCALSFDPGSMGPKVEAVCTFVRRTGRFAAIGALEDALQVVAGQAGTRVTPDPTAALATGSASKL